MLMRRDELAAAIGPDESIYVVGGYGGGENNCLDTAERFDIISRKWEMLPKLNVGRRALSVVALPDGIYAIGGYSGKQYISSVERFDIEKNCWTLIEELQSPKCTLSCAVSVPDFRYIYALGGFNGKPLDEVERYDITQEKWEVLRSVRMKSKRFMHASLIICI
jgi:hypothetical protein